MTEQVNGYQLYTYWRSSASYRVRIALNCKQLDYQSLPVDLIKPLTTDGIEQIKGQQKSPEYTQLNPAQLVPCLVTPNGDVLNQSLAIIEYLEERVPKPALLPSEPLKKAQVRAFALDIACDIHPMNNLRVTQFLQDKLSVAEEGKMQWYHHWLHLGFANLEKRLAQHAGHFCFANDFSMADICLVPQVYNALRFSLDMKPYANINRIYSNCLSLPEVNLAAPDKHQT
ncbi:maleylacetoacetate isomerase [Catenovulum sp. SM1970]|uniref:maleylacetoacetate isomerase n=1 Tax=Marinifaba aquimaris TaxID=2741323 RepID=UPI00157186A1|nr:maleylacetoacetate isomerase [Marinifaba aquimaris]NTS78804.1 maleylacetoacetate isomerase [Marinifaba aquimaris]